MLAGGGFDVDDKQHVELVEKGNKRLLNFVHRTSMTRCACSIPECLDAEERIVTAHHITVERFRGHKGEAGPFFPSIS